MKVALNGNTFIETPSKSPNFCMKVPLERLHKHLLALFELETAWNRRSVSDRRTYEQLLRAFNQAANQINQMLHLEDEQKIPMAIEPMERPKSSVYPSLVFHPLTGVEIEQNESLNYIGILCGKSQMSCHTTEEEKPFYEMRDDFILQYGRNPTLKDIMENPSLTYLYNIRSELIRTGKVILLHDSENGPVYVLQEDISKIIELWMGLITTNLALLGIFVPLASACQRDKNSNKQLPTDLVTNKVVRVSMCQRKMVALYHATNLLICEINQCTMESSTSCQKLSPKTKS
jgi:hypothetical protein